MSFFGRNKSPLQKSKAHNFDKEEPAGLTAEEMWGMHKGGIARLVENCKREEAQMNMKSPFSKRSPIRGLEQARKEIGIKIDAANELAGILKELEGYEPGILERMYAYKKLERDWETREAAKTVKKRDGL